MTLAKGCERGAARRARTGALILTQARKSQGKSAPGGVSHAPDGPVPMPNAPGRPAAAGGSRHRRQSGRGRRRLLGQVEGAGLPAAAEGENHRPARDGERQCRAARTSAGFTLAHARLPFALLDSGRRVSPISGRGCQSARSRGPGRGVPETSTTGSDGERCTARAIPCGSAGSCPGSRSAPRPRLPHRPLEAERAEDLKAEGPGAGAPGPGRVAAQAPGRGAALPAALLRPRPPRGRFSPLPSSPPVLRQRRGRPRLDEHRLVYPFGRDPGPDQLLDLGKRIDVALTGKAYRFALRPHPGSPSDAVHVVFRVLGEGRS